MKFSQIFLGLALSTSFTLAPTYQAFAAKTGETAPQFSTQSFDGKKLSLSDYKGKYVVLEWHNKGCPYVKKHYNSGNMQKLQSEWGKKGVIWLTLISSAKGKEGFVSAEEEKKYLASEKASPTHVVFDTDGKIGKLYGAKTTPHMFLVNPEGILVYNGAIDDKASTDASDIPSSKNLISAALTEAMAGKTITVSSTPPYGCSIKYQD